MLVTPEVIGTQKKATAELLEKYGFTREKFEIRKGIKEDGDYPEVIKRHRIVYETYQASVEETYYWIFNFINQECGFKDVYKISDYFGSSESAAFFGVNQQRLAAQQDKVAQFLGTIANMIKSLFQLVREIRILDERIKLYEDSDYKRKDKGEKADKSAEISLKGIWIDLVEGGSKNPSSVYGLAREVGFTILPDLFFDANPMASSAVDSYVDKLEFNRKVKEVLARKLKVYLIWKEHTYKELKNRRTFTLKYLRQHFSVIKMYSEWITPYLRNIRRMTLKDYSTNAQLIAAFENTMIDLEFLAIKPVQDASGKAAAYKPCFLATFFYRTTPSLNYQQEGFQRGPIHVGRIEIDLRAYAWTDNQITNFLKFRNEEKIEVLTSINESVQAAYDALGEDLKKYLEEAEASEEKEPEEATRTQVMSPLTPFTSVFTGLGDLFGAFFTKRCSKCGALNNLKSAQCAKCKTKFAKKEEKTNYKLALEKKAAEKEAKTGLWTVYDKYKKAHRMVTW